VSGLVAGNVDAPFPLFFYEGGGDGFTPVAAVFVETSEEEFGSSIGEFIIAVEGVTYSNFSVLAG